MPNYPLLIFPSPERVNRVKRKYKFGSKTHIPDSSRQGERLSPVFQQLQNSLEARRMELQQSSSGIVPEQVLVFETVGSVENFIMAVKKIDGMEWLSEVDIDDIVPDSDFYDADNRDAILTGRLYMIMTNQQAMNDLLSLWGRYNNDPNMSFDRGLAPFKKIFVCLKDIRKWDVQDRLIETGVIEAWKEDLLSQDRQSIPFEIELWFRNDVSVRNFNQQDISQKIHDLGGQVLSTSVIEPIAFHGVLGELPRAEIQKIIDNINNDQTIHLLKCENVMFFRPSGQFFISDSLDDGVVDGCQLSPIPIPVGEPIVGILDGLPLGNHQLLHNRLIIDDPDSYTDEYQAQERIHGTTIASLVIHGDLYDTGAPLPSPVYIRPIMKPVDWHSSPRPEAIPATNLFVDLIHRAVLRMFDGEGTEPPLAPSVKIINFSIGDQYRHFANTMSPMARLLDWLSLKYDVLFVVSSGNHNKSVRVEISPNCTEEGSIFDLISNGNPNYFNITADQQEKEFLKSVFIDSRNRRLLSPSESINCLTVGSVHSDNATIQNNDQRINPYFNILPSPYSAFGSGYRKAVKPDLVVPGGRILYVKPLSDSNPCEFRPWSQTSAPGLKVAYPSNQPGNITSTAHSRGTSNSAAIVSRNAGFYYNVLQDIQETSGFSIDGCTAPLIKAMIVHGCTWDEIGTHLYNALDHFVNGRNWKSIISRWIGYGIPQFDKVLGCTDQRATLIGYGQLGTDEAHVYSLPLPPSLSSQRVKKRLTVTLAWFSPISVMTQKYRTAKLWFEVSGTPLTPNRPFYDDDAVQRGTLQHEVFENDKAVPFDEGDLIQIKVICKEDAGRISGTVKYGLVVSIEVAEGLDIAIYNEIRTRIQSRVHVAPQG